jgi:hypothetical protein
MKKNRRPDGDHVPGELMVLPAASITVQEPCPVGIGH